VNVLALMAVARRCALLAAMRSKLISRAASPLT